MILKLVDKLNTFFRDEQGNSFFLVSIALVTLLAITGVAMDGGALYATKSHLQKTANAAVLSGAQELTYTEEAVHSVIHRVLEEHEEEASLIAITIEDSYRVRVELEKEVSFSFLRMLGYESSTVYAVAAAELGTMGQAMGAAPLGIDERIDLEYNKPYRLKVDEEDVDTGNFGILALGGSGARTYEDNLKYGYQSMISLGDILDTQTGNIAGKTRDGVNARLNACPYESGQTHHRDCPRVILIPVYKPHNQNNNQLKEVEVTGFAYFYLLEPMGQHDKEIYGMFIERAGTGFFDPSSANKGAYVIRLTE